MKIWLACIMIGFAQYWGINLFAQDQLNRIYQQEKIALTYTESIWLNDTLIIAGSYIDSLGKGECLINYMNRIGDIIFTNEEIDTSLLYSFKYFSKGLTLVGDTLYQFGYKVIASDSTSNGIKLYGIFNKFDRKGTKIFESELKGKYYPIENFARPNDFIIVGNKIYVTYLAWNHSTNIPNGQICLAQLDYEGSILWDTCYGNQTREVSNNVLVNSQGDILIIGDSHNLHYQDEYQGLGNGFWNGYIIQLDSMGNLKWEWRSPSPRESANAGLLITDSTIVVAAGYGIEYCDVPGEPLSWCNIYWTGGAYQMDLKTRTKTWETSLSGGPHTIKDDNQYFDIIQSIEKDGYLLCGSGYDLPDPNCHQIDTIKCWSSPGVIAKVANNGDSLWLRKFFGVIDVWESNTLFDIEITPDSSYSFVGAAYDPIPGEIQGQHGWVLKTDKFGCLVPGCHLVSSSKDNHKENTTTKSVMKVYPNPATDILNVLITDKISSNATLYLINSLGQQIDSWTWFEEGATYIIPINRHAAGVYVLSMIQNNMIIDIETIIIKGCN